MAAPPGAHVQCAPSYFQGPWDAVVVPASVFFSSPDLRKGRLASQVIVYGPPHLFRSAWLGGAKDYLREPWTVDELFLRLRGPTPARLEWMDGEDLVVLEDHHLSADGTVALSSAESDILRMLVQRRGLPVSRAILGWAARCTEGRVIDTLIGRIRRKLAIVGSAGTVEAVRGVGYRLP